MPGTHSALVSFLSDDVASATSPNPSKMKIMGLFSKDIKSMDDLFIHTLQDIYYAENQILKSLPDMIEKAADPKLKQGFQTHLNETKNHVKRLEPGFPLEGQAERSLG